MILRFVKIMGLLRLSRTYSGKSPSKTLRDTKFRWGGFPKQISKIVGFGGAIFEKCSKFQKVEN